MKRRDGLALTPGNTLLYRSGFATYYITPRIVHNIHRDGSPDTVYDLSAMTDDATRITNDYGTYFSIEDAIHKCETLNKKGK